MNVRVLVLEMAFAHMAPGLTAFLESHPGLGLHFRTRSGLPDFVRDNIDACVFIGELPTDNVVARLVGRVPFPITASPGYLERQGIPQRPEDLDCHNCIGILSSQSHRPLEWCFQSEGRFFTRNVTGNVEFEAGEPAVAAAEAGAGVLQMIGYLVAAGIKARRLVPVLRDYLYPGAPIYYVYQPHRRLPRKIRVFEDFLRQRLAETAQELRTEIAAGS